MLTITRIRTFAYLKRHYSSVFAPEHLLSEENITKTMARFVAAQPIRMQPNEPPKKAAVLIPLCVVDDKVALLYTLRAANLKTHRGQVSFPGGMQDVKDKSLISTALRETKEELGIPEKEIFVWGSGNMIVSRSDMCVLPVVGYLKGVFEWENLKINQQEVEDVFVVPIEDLCDQKYLKHTQFRNAYSTPLFLSGKYRIWGLTAMITHVFLKCFLPKQIYSHRIKYISNVKNSSSQRQILR